MQRTGPISPKSTIGGINSPSTVLANGDTINVNGTAVCLSMSAVDGMLYNDDLKVEEDQYEMLCIPNTCEKAVNCQVDLPLS